MAYIGTRIQADTLAFNEVQATIQKAPNEMRVRIKRRTDKIRRQIKAEFRAPDDLPRLPFIWSFATAAQIRARKWWFAHLHEENLFTEGGRYQRTGKLESAWDVQFVEDDKGGYISLSNPADGVDYVYGEKQVPTHQETGWVSLNEIEEKYSNILNLQLIDEWYAVSNPYDGER